MNPSTPFRAETVIAFLSALSIALKTSAREGSFPDGRDPYRLVIAEIDQFFENLPEHENLSPEGQNELAQLRNIFQDCYQDADFVMLDPLTDTSH